MAVSMSNLSASQKAIVNKIISAGKSLGLTDVVIEAAVNIANAESTFDTGAAATTSRGRFRKRNLKHVKPVAMAVVA